MIKRMTCIECPQGCNLSVDVENCTIVSIKGAKCPKGIVYAASEIENPARILTATVRADGLMPRLVPVRTDKPIPKRDLFRAMAEMRKMRVKRPLKAGDVIVEDFLGLGVNLVATREVLAIVSS